MADILIKGIKMPNKKHFLQILIAENGDLSYEDACYDFPRTGFILHESKAIEVPPHGRLIDADVLMETLKEVPITDEKTEGIFTKMMCDFAIQILEKSVTVLEASKETE